MSVPIRGKTDQCGEKPIKSDEHSLGSDAARMREALVDQRLELALVDQRLELALRAPAEGNLTHLPRASSYRSAASVPRARLPKA